MQQRNKVKIIYDEPEEAFAKIMSFLRDQGLPSMKDLHEQFAIRRVLDAATAVTVPPLRI